MDKREAYPRKVKKLLTLLIGSLTSFIIASQIDNFAKIVPDIELTGVPLILSPITVSLFLISEGHLLEKHRLLLLFLFLPFIVLFLGYFLFALTLRNLK